MSQVFEDWVRALRTLVDPDAKLFLLEPPAPAEEVEGLRETLRETWSVEVSASFTDMYSAFDGERVYSGGLFFGLQQLSLQQVYNIYGDFKENTPYDRPGATSNPPDAIKAAWFNKRWLPFAKDNGGSYLALDYDPGPAGTVGQVITMGNGEKTQSVVAHSFDAFLLELTALLEAGNFVVVRNRLALKDPPMTHFLDRYVPALVERARRIAACPTPVLRAELVPQRPTSIDLNEGKFGSPPPDLARVEKLVLWTKPGELWQEWVCEANRGYSFCVPNVDLTEVEAAFHREVANWEAQGFAVKVVQEPV